MPVTHPATIDEATTLLAEHPTATLLAGGTDVMVEINEGHRRPDDYVVVVNRIADLRSWRHDPAARTVTLGAGVTYSEIIDGPLAELVPSLAEASRTVGSPQIRNAGTLGGNLGTASPAGDGLPVLVALGATVRLDSASGTRTMTVEDFLVGVKRNALLPGELISEITIPIIDGWQGYAKVGVRNAMVIAVASVAISIDRAAQRVAIALGSVGPTILRCPAAEALLTQTIDWPTLHVDSGTLDEVATLVSGASAPITDHRSSAEYRRHAVGVLAKRLVRRAGGGS